MNIVSPQAIRDFFDKLNLSSVDYILIRNMGGELPDSLNTGKDIDLLCKYQDRKRIHKFLEHNGFNQLKHPCDSHLFLYGVNKPEMFSNNEGVLIDINYQLTCRSLNAGELVPLDQGIQESAWANKAIVNSDGFSCVRLGIDDEFVALVSRSVFDKREFLQVYIRGIESALGRIDEENVLRKLGLIFFKYAPILFKQIQGKKYDAVYENYIAFKEY